MDGLNIEVSIDIKLLRECIYTLTDELLTDEELQKHFIQEPMSIEAKEHLGSLAIPVVSMLLSGVIKSKVKTKENPPKSRFQTKLDEMLSRNK